MNALTEQLKDQQKLLSSFAHDPDLTVDGNQWRAGRCQKRLRGTVQSMPAVRLTTHKWTCTLAAYYASDRRARAVPPDGCGRGPVCTRTAQFTSDDTPTDQQQGTDRRLRYSTVRQDAHTGRQGKTCRKAAGAGRDMTSIKAEG